MKNSSYECYLKKYNETKPIRGRDVDVRPIGERRRDWERIELGAQGEVRCVFYETPVVTYYPNGEIAVRQGRWATVNTSEFMYTHSPFIVSMAHKKLWVDVKGTKYPIVDSEPLVMVFVRDSGGDGSTWIPKDLKPYKVQMVDRMKAKEVRAPYEGFITFVNTFLKMSDGWVMEATRCQFGERKMGRFAAQYSYGIGTDWLQALDSRGRDKVGDDVDSLYMRAMLVMLMGVESVARVSGTVVMEEEDNKQARVYQSTGTRTVKLFDKQYDVKAARQKIYDAIEAKYQPYKTKDVMPDDKIRRGVVV